MDNKLLMLIVKVLPTHILPIYTHYAICLPPTPAPPPPPISEILHMIPNPLHIFSIPSPFSVKGSVKRSNIDREGGDVALNRKVARCLLLVLKHTVDTKGGALLPSQLRGR